MVKLTSTKGYTLIESLLVLYIIGLLMLLSVPYFKLSFQKPMTTVIDDIVCKQFEAIMNNERTYYTEYGCDIHFNRVGHINMANTYNINGTEIIVSLATGRVYVKKGK